MGEASRLSHLCIADRTNVGKAVGSSLFNKRPNCCCIPLSDHDAVLFQFPIETSII